MREIRAPPARLLTSALRPPVGVGLPYEVPPLAAYRANYVRLLEQTMCRSRLADRANLREAPGVRLCSSLTTPSQLSAPITPSARGLRCSCPNVSGVRYFSAGCDDLEKLRNHVLDNRNSPASDSPRLCRTIVRRSAGPAWRAPLNHPSRTTVAGPPMRAGPPAYHPPRTLHLYCPLRSDEIVWLYPPPPPAQISPSPLLEFGGKAAA